MLPINSWAVSNNKYDTAYKICVKEAGTINNGVVDACSRFVSNKAKKDMNKLYNIIYNNISKQSIDDAKKFEKSQKNWLKYREAHCELMGLYVGSPSYSYCPMELNKLRVLELTVLASQFIE